jgi:hypothetical protein
MILACTVCICTHNPRADYLQRTLKSLEGQTLPRERWELFVIDNASKVPLAGQWDLSWHPHARHIREDELGLTPARLRGIREARSDLILFVDDDNILSADYLTVLLGLVAEHPQLGCFGAGILTPEFEQEPTPLLRRFTAGLALRSTEAPRWSNSMTDQIVPWGAGLAVRRPVAEKFAEVVKNSPLRKNLERSGTSLNSGGDDEFSWVACEMGLGKGIFPALQIIHLIAARRLEKSYLLSITRGHAFSHVLLDYIHDHVSPSPLPPSTLGDIMTSLCGGKLYMTLRHAKSWLGGFRRLAIDKEFDTARRAGIDEANKKLAELPPKKSDH